MSAVLADVQTSAPAPETDLFGMPATPPGRPKGAAAAGADCALVFEGRLHRKPHVVMKPMDGGHFAPAVELHMEDVGAGHHQVVAHVLFRPADRDLAEAHARRLQRGQLVAVTTQLSDIRLLLPAASLSVNDNP